AMSVLVPLTVADLTRGTGRFNLSQGMIGMMTGLGATLSPTFAGFISDTFGSPFAFLGLAGWAGAGLLAVWLFIPETRPAPPGSRNDGNDAGPRAVSL